MQYVQLCRVCTRVHISCNNAYKNQTFVRQFVLRVTDPKTDRNNPYRVDNELRSFWLLTDTHGKTEVLFRLFFRWTSNG
jgi:hypothetical protein